MWFTEKRSLGTSLTEIVVLTDEQGGISPCSSIDSFPRLTTIMSKFFVLTFEAFLNGIRLSVGNFVFLSLFVQTLTGLCPPNYWKFPAIRTFHHELRFLSERNSNSPSNLVGTLNIYGAVLSSWPYVGLCIKSYSLMLMLTSFCEKENKLIVEKSKVLIKIAQLLLVGS